MPPQQQPEQIPANCILPRIYYSSPLQQFSRSSHCLLSLTLQASLSDVKMTTPQKVSQATHSTAFLQALYHTVQPPSNGEATSGLRANWCFPQQTSPLWPSVHQYFSNRQAHASHLSQVKLTPHSDYPYSSPWHQHIPFY